MTFVDSWRPKSDYNGQISFALRVMRSYAGDTAGPNAVNSGMRARIHARHACIYAHTYMGSCDRLALAVRDVVVTKALR